MKRLPFLFSWWLFAVNWTGAACGKVAYFGYYEMAERAGAALLETRGVAGVKVVNRNTGTLQFDLRK